MGKDFMCMKMARSSKECTPMGRERAPVSANTLMAIGMMGITPITRNMGKGCFTGRMGISFLGSLLKGNGTVLACTFTRMVINMKDILLMVRQRGSAFSTLLGEIGFKGNTSQGKNTALALTCSQLVISMKVSTGME